MDYRKFSRPCGTPLQRGEFEWIHRSPRAVPAGRTVRSPPQWAACETTAVQRSGLAGAVSDWTLATGDGLAVSGHGLVERARRAADLTQGELACRAHTSRPTLSAYETAAARHIFADAGVIVGGSRLRCRGCASRRSRGCAGRSQSAVSESVLVTATADCRCDGNGCGAARIEPVQSVPGASRRAGSVVRNRGPRGNAEDVLPYIIEPSSMCGLRWFRLDVLAAWRSVIDALSCSS